MLINVNELSGPALDWAVAKCEKIEDFNDDNRPYLKHCTIYEEYSPSSNWAQGGPIIEKKQISINKLPLHCVADIRDRYTTILSMYGPTPLIVAMRCYVASELGNKIEIPNNL